MVSSPPRKWGQGFKGMFNKKNPQLEIRESVSHGNASHANQTDTKPNSKIGAIKTVPPPMACEEPGTFDKLRQNILNYKPSYSHRDVILDLHKRLLHPSLEELQHTLRESGLQVFDGFHLRHLCKQCSFNLVGRRRRLNKRNIMRKPNKGFLILTRNDERQKQEISLILAQPREEVVSEFGANIHHILLKTSIPDPYGREIISLLIDVGTGWVCAQALESATDAHLHLRSFVSEVRSKYKGRTTIQTYHDKDLNAEEYRKEWMDLKLLRVITHGGSHLCYTVIEPLVERMKEMIYRALRRLNIEDDRWYSVLQAACGIHNIIATQSGSPYYRRFGKSPGLALIPFDMVMYEDRLSRQNFAGLYVERDYQGRYHVLDVHTERLRFTKLVRDSIRPVLREIGCSLMKANSVNRSSYKMPESDTSDSSFDEESDELYEDSETSSTESMEHYNTKGVGENRVTGEVWYPEDEEELVNMISRGVFGEKIPRRLQPFYFVTHLIHLPEKEDSIHDGSMAARKPRLAVDGSNDPRKVETHMDLPDFSSLRLVLIAALRKDWNIYRSFISNAYIHASSNNEVETWTACRMPKNLPQRIRAMGYQSGKVYSIKKAIYGLKDSGNLFMKYVDSICIELDYKKIASGLYVRYRAGEVNSILFIYVNSIILSGIGGAGDLDELSQFFEIDDNTYLCREDEPFDFCGVSFTLKHRQIIMSLNSYIKPEVPKRPLPNRVFCHNMQKSLAEKPSGGTPYSSEELKKTRSLIGKLGWTSKFLWRAAYMHAKLSCYSYYNPQELISTLQTCFARLERRDYDKLSGDRSSLELRIWAVASFDDPTNTGHIGWAIQLINRAYPSHLKDNIVMWKSKRIKAKVEDSIVAEQIAIVEALDAATELYRIVTVLIGSVNATLFITDSDCLYDPFICSEARGDYIQSKLQEMNCDLETVNDWDSLAVMLTRWV